MNYRINRNKFLIFLQILLSSMIFNGQNAVADEEQNGDYDCTWIKQNNVLTDTCTGEPVFPPADCAYVTLKNSGDERISASATLAQCNYLSSYGGVRSSQYGVTTETGSVLAVIGGSVTLHFHRGGEGGTTDSKTFTNIGENQTINCTSETVFLSNRTSCSISGDPYNRENAAKSAAEATAYSEAKSDFLDVLKQYIQLGVNQGTDFFDTYEWFDAMFTRSIRYSDIDVPNFSDSEMKKYDWYNDKINIDTPYSDIAITYFSQVLQQEAKESLSSLFNSNANDIYYSSGNSCDRLRKVANESDTLSMGYCKSSGELVTFRQYEKLTNNETVSSVNIICESSAVEGCNIKLTDHSSDNTVQISNCGGANEECEDHSYYGAADVVYVNLHNGNDWFDASNLSEYCTPLRINAGKTLSTEIDRTIRTGCGDDVVMTNHRVGTYAQATVNLGKGSNIALAEGWISGIAGNAGNGTVIYEGYERESPQSVAQTLAPALMHQLLSWGEAGYSEKKAMHISLWYDLTDRSKVTPKLVDLYVADLNEERANRPEPTPHPGR